MPSKTQTDRINTLESTVAVLVEIRKLQQEDMAAFKSTLKDRDEARKVQDAAFVELYKSHSLLQQRHDDYVRRAEVWGQRWWALVPLLVGAVLTLCSGLVVALARK